MSSQWRLDVGGTARLPDLLAVDVGNARVVVVELKAVPDPSTVTQARTSELSLR